MLLPACTVDTDLNVDPSSPQDASLDVMLPSTQVYIGYAQGSDMTRIPALFTQHFFGMFRQHQGLYDYNLKEDDLDNVWLNTYTGPMLDLSIMIQKSTDNESPHYKGVAQVLTAYTLSLWADLLGALPYTESFQGNKKLNPKYDTQEEIYNIIKTLCDDALVNLAAAESNFSPGPDDLIYGGDLALWAQAANLLMARTSLHKKDYAGALTYLQSGFTSSADDMQCPFGSKGAEANPLYQFNDQRGDITMGPKLMELMNGFEDPRLPMFAELDESDAYSTESLVGPFYGSQNSPVPFLLYSEQKFIEAECVFAQNGASAAHQIYLDAITASMERFGVAQADIDTYLARPDVDPGDGNLTLKHIIEQKYIACFFMAETWTDWRRTGIPALTPSKGTEIPRRFFYPQSERLFNGTSLQAAVPGFNDPNFIFTKVWWDQTYW